MTKRDSPPWERLIAVCTLASTIIGLWAIYQANIDNKVRLESRLTHLEDMVVDLSARVDRAESRSK